VKQLTTRTIYCSYMFRSCKFIISSDKQKNIYKIAVAKDEISLLHLIKSHISHVCLIRKSKWVKMGSINWWQQALCKSGQTGQARRSVFVLRYARERLVRSNKGVLVCGPPYHAVNSIRVRVIERSESDRSWSQWRIIQTCARNNEGKNNENIFRQHISWNGRNSNLAHVKNKSREQPLH
jgi:hypothetical protein